jgi:putative ubiquitin-RnfH superfamily antitoxin RatB of RatAB toxin-antitoxin module
VGAPSMGGFSYGGSTTVEQASASDLPREDAGAPTPATVGKVSVLTRVNDFSLGYGETIDKHTRLESPTLFITVSYVFASERREVKVPWHEGLTVHHAFKHARLKDQLFRHVSVFSYKKTVNARKVRQTHVLHAGDTLLLSAVGKALS